MRVKHKGCGGELDMSSDRRVICVRCGEEVEAWDRDPAGTVCLSMALEDPVTVAERRARLRAIQGGKALLLAVGLMLASVLPAAAQDVPAEDTAGRLYRLCAGIDGPEGTFVCKGRIDGWLTGFSAGAAWVASEDLHAIVPDPWMTSQVMNYLFMRWAEGAPGRLDEHWSVVLFEILTNEGTER